MSETLSAAPNPTGANGANTASAADGAAGAVTAGRLLREARERQGLHIAALAASIKVVPKKLEMLEADRFDALPDATFTRALAQTVCRALKMDAAPVLRLLPPPVGHRLEHVAEGLNAPFRDRPGMAVQRDWGAFASRPVFWITATILVAAAAVFLLPSGLIRLPTPTAPTASGGPAVVVVPIDATATAPSPPRPGETPGMPPGAPAEISGPRATDAATPLATTADAASAAVSASPGGAAITAGLLQLRTTAPSWVEVNDASGQALIARLVRPGEAVDLDGAPPLRVRIGNAAATRLTFRGQPTELAAYTRDNVARLELR